MEERTCALVLGAMVREGGVASPALRRRAEHAAALFQAGRVARVVCSGAERWHAPSEARIAAMVCAEAGVPEAALALEEAARTTLENLVLSRPLLAGFARVVIVTDRFHAPRARLLAERIGLVAEVSSPAYRPPVTQRLVASRLREAGALAWSWASGEGRGHDGKR
ncbi:YdcF family protein [Sagittula salina]|uniref:YdcF family protein n=1 Tax=Sagittula salina TaxID=2820268 RepID=A0A940MS96_9RHOB|nr:YdcF family protein [Sagittula salina]MBP0483871.1 YdcF family protein [Sagittula salina]